LKTLITAHSEQGDYLGDAATMTDLVFIILLCLAMTKKDDEVPEFYFSGKQGEASG
jgi:hypothetical protein